MTLKHSRLEILRDAMITLSREHELVLDEPAWELA